MKYEPGDCSPEASARIITFVDNVGITKGGVRTKYPFGDLLIGKAFTVPFDDVSEGALRTTASLQARQQGKKFIVIKHKQYNCYEVARIA